MSYIVYIIESETTKRKYIGYTHDIIERLKRHNKGATRTTRIIGTHWKVIYQENYESKIEAMRRERALKRMKGNEQFKKLINRAGIV